MSNLFNTALKLLLSDTPESFEMLQDMVQKAPPPQRVPAEVGGTKMKEETTLTTTRGPPRTSGPRKRQTDSLNKQLQARSKRLKSQGL